MLHYGMSQPRLDTFHVLSGHTWLMTTILDSTALNTWSFIEEQLKLMQMQLEYSTQYSELPEEMQISRHICSLSFSKDP